MIWFLPYILYSTVMVSNCENDRLEFEYIFLPGVISLVTISFSVIYCLYSQGSSTLFHCHIAILMISNYRAHPKRAFIVNKKQSFLFFCLGQHHQMQVESKYLAYIVVYNQHLQMWVPHWISTDIIRCESILRAGLFHILA